MPFNDANLHVSPVHASNEAPDPLPETCVSPAGNTASACAFRKAFARLLDNVTLTTALPFWLLKLGPQCFRDIAVARGDAKRHVRTLLARAAQVGGGGFLASVARGSGAEVAPDGKSRPRGLSDEEAVGSAGVVALTGHGSCASVLWCAIVMLAMYPEEQRWLQRMLDEALRDEAEDPAGWEFERVFPKLSSALCVMVMIFTSFFISYKF
jgi:hypothetical protein